MKELFMEMIKKRARIDHDGDVNKATEEFFKDHPEWWEEYRKETAFPVGAVIKDSNE